MYSAKQKHTFKTTNMFWNIAQLSHFIEMQAESIILLHSAGQLSERKQHFSFTFRKN